VSGAGSDEEVFEAEGGSNTLSNDLVLPLEDTIIPSVT